VPEHPNAVAPVVGQAAQVPPQDRVSVLHVIPHVVPLQVAAPFGGTGQAEHDAPQLATLLFATQLPAQTWYPDAQAVAAHDVPAQAKAVAFAVGQTAQTPPQSRTAALVAVHAPPQRSNPVLQVQARVAASQVSLAPHCVSVAQPGLHCPFDRSQ
jgi:hypothetical protein